jgi:hypothetical protein
MSNHSLSLSEYVAWLFKKYQKLKQETQCTETYRIIKIINPTVGTCKLKIQIIGTDKTLEWEPEYIAKNNQLLEGFSKIDIRTITYYACEERSKPKLTILSHSFSDKLKRILFKVKNRKSNNILEKTASDFLLNNEIVNQLAPQDALRVGYLCGSEEADRERETLEQLKEKPPSNTKNP